VKILLLGSGAREHALARALVADPATTELVVVPGNPGIAEIATTFKADPSSASDVTALAAIEKALRDSDLGVNPSNDGAAIRVVMPEMTAERRKEYTKLVNHKAEEARISVRNIRRHAKTTIDKYVKDGEIGEDDGARAEKELDALTKKHVDTIDELYKHKESELLEV